MTGTNDGNQERADFFYGLEDAEREKEKANRRSFSYDNALKPASAEEEDLS